jgi:hypothetical protein
VRARAIVDGSLCPLSSLWTVPASGRFAQSSLQLSAPSSSFNEIAFRPVTKGENATTRNRAPTR